MALTKTALLKAVQTAKNRQMPGFERLPLRDQMRSATYAKEDVVRQLAETLNLDANDVAQLVQNAPALTPRPPSRQRTPLRSPRSPRSPQTSVTDASPLSPVTMSIHSPRHFAWVLGTVGGLPMLGQRVGLGLRGEEVVVLTPLSMNGELNKAVSGCGELNSSSSHRSSHRAFFGAFWGSARTGR